MLVVWFVVCLVIGAAAGLYYGIWGGAGILILGIPGYFMGPPSLREQVPERWALLGGILAFAVSAVILPIGLSLGLLTP